MITKDIKAYKLLSSKCEEAELLDLQIPVSYKINLIIMPDFTDVCLNRNSTSGVGPHGKVCV